MEHCGKRTPTEEWITWFQGKFEYEFKLIPSQNLQSAFSSHINIHYQNKRKFFVIFCTLLSMYEKDNRIEFSIFPPHDVCLLVGKFSERQVFLGRDDDVDSFIVFAGKPNFIQSFIVR